MFNEFKFQKKLHKPLNYGSTEIIQMRHRKIKRCNGSCHAQSLVKNTSSNVRDVCCINKAVVAACVTPRGSLLSTALYVNIHLMMCILNSVGV